MWQLVVKIWAAGVIMDGMPADLKPYHDLVACMKGAESWVAEAPKHKMRLIAVGCKDVGAPYVR